MTTSEGWIFEDSEPKSTNDFPDTVEPYMLLSTQEQWDNYSNKEAYDFEVRLRGFLAYMKSHGKYRSAKSRRFTYSMVYQRLYGKEPEALFNPASMVNRQILGYYSSRLLEDTEIEGKRCKRVYVLAYSRLSRRPWCIKLRLEWYMENGEPIEPGKLRCIKKQLQWGHARNPRTEQNMEARRERSREAYRRKYNTPEYRAYIKSLHDGEQR